MRYDGPSALPDFYKNKKSVRPASVSIIHDTLCTEKSPVILRICTAAGSNRASPRTAVRKKSRTSPRTMWFFLSPKSCENVFSACDLTVLAHPRIFTKIFFWNQNFHSNTHPFNFFSSKNGRLLLNACGNRVLAPSKYITKILIFWKFQFWWAVKKKYFCKNPAMR